MYTLEILPRAERELKRLDSPTNQRVRERLKWFAEHFEEITPEALTGEWAGLYKFRVGDYRALYQFNRAQRHIAVFRIRHRREVYD